MSAMPDESYVFSEPLRMELDKRGVNWPLGSYYPGPDLKVCRCPDCDRIFTADQRCLRCLPCAIHDVRSNYAAFGRMYEELLDIVEEDERRSGISNRGHWAYPTFCTAARSRLAAMQRDIDELRPVVDLLEGVEA